jgi:hypothetical protein
MQRAARHVERDDASAGAVFHDQVDREVFDEESRFVLQRLLVQRVQHGVTGAVGRGARALCDALAVVRRHAAERAAVYAPVFGARERHAVMLEFDDGRRRFLAHVLDRVLVAQPVRSLDGVVEVKRQSSRPCCRAQALMPPCAAHRVTARWKHLVMQAVFSPRSARPNVARSPAPPAPTTMTS